MEKTALIIEDSEHYATIISFLFKREGFEVRHAYDGRQAKELIANSPPPSFIILDLMLPYFDGFQLLEQIRTNPGWQRVPIIILTGKSGEQDIVRGFDLGANDYMIKPFKPEELLARIRRHMQSSNASETVL